MAIKQDRLVALIYEALETELGGVQVYEAAIRCARSEGLREEWTKYLKETRRHVEVVQGLCDVFDLDRSRETPGRQIVRAMGETLVQAMRQAAASGDAAAAECVAGECVVLAETKDHLNWKLLEKCAEELDGPKGKALRDAVDEVEDQEDEHLYHSTGWTREVWFASLGIRPVVPPPEEQKDVHTKIGAARAEKARDEMKSEPEEKKARS